MKNVVITNLPLKLTPQQQQVFDACKFGNGIQEVIACTGRQVGKTSVAQEIALYWALTNNNNKTGFFLPTFKQCSKISDHFQQLNRKIGSKNLLSINKNKGSIRFLNGSTIQLLSGESRDSIRGYSFDQIIVDEACYIQDEVFNAAILPTVMVSITKRPQTAKILLLSTPKSKNWFYTRIADSSKKSFLIRMTSEEGGFISKDELENIAKNVPSQIFKNEFLGEFLESGAGLFKYVDCIRKDIDFAANEKYVAAVDWGAQNDYTVLTIMSLSGKVKLIKRWRMMDYSEIVRHIVKEITPLRPQVFSEKNGAGLMPTQELAKNYPLTTGVDTTNKSKVEIIQKLMLDFEQQRIIIPDNIELHHELDNYMMEYTEKTKAITYNAKAGFHDDMVMSLALANYKRNEVKKPIKIMGF